MRYRPNKRYLIIAALLLLTEVLIAAYMHDALIRPYGGDFLVVILVYCAVRSFFTADVFKMATGVLLFAYIVEITQYFHLIDVLGWSSSIIARNILGTTFRWADMLAYTLGMLLVLYIEKLLRRQQKTT